MLTFDDSVHSDGLVSCFIRVDEPKMGRVTFYIGPTILQDVLHGAPAFAMMLKAPATSAWTPRWVPPLAASHTKPLICRVSSVVEQRFCNSGLAIPAGSIACHSVNVFGRKTRSRPRGRTGSFYRVPPNLIG
jgi:hypothetical protein